MKNTKNLVSSEKLGYDKKLLLRIILTKNLKVFADIRSKEENNKAQKDPILENIRYAVLMKSANRTSDSSCIQ